MWFIRAAAWFSIEPQTATLPPTHQNNNTDETRVSSSQPTGHRVLGYRWGDDTTELLQASEGGEGGEGFDMVLMSDVLYELEHTLLLRTCHSVLKTHGQVRDSAALLEHKPSHLRFACDRGKSIQ